MREELWKRIIFVYWKMMLENGWYDRTLKYNHSIQAV